MESPNNQIKNILRVGWEEEILKNIKPLADLLHNLSETPKVITIHCIRHYDLDGVGVELVMRKLAKATGCEVIFYEEPTNADESFKKILETMTPYDYIVIGDLSFSNKDFIDKLLEDHFDLAEKIILLDHHESAMWMNEYSFAFVKSHNSKNCIISSGAILVFLAFKYLIYGGVYRDEYSVLEKLCNCIAAYDTYFFKEQPYLSESQYGSYPNDLNILFKYYNDIGKKDEFIQALCDMKWKPTLTLDGKEIIAAGVHLDISEKDQTIIELQKNNIQSETNRALHHMRVGTIISESVKYNSSYNGKLTYGVYYYTGPYKSEIGNAMCTNCVDFGIIIDMNNHSVSLRCKADDLDLTKLIENIPNAGGHPKACGFEFDGNLEHEIESSIISMLK